MSTLQNTLNAYVGKLKAQRKAAEREAQAQLRAKSVEQRLAEKMLRETQRIQKEKQEKEAREKNVATEGVDFYLDKVARRFKNDLGQEFGSGERAQVTSDLKTLCKLFFYQGPVPGNKLYKIIDTKHYSKATYQMMVSVLANMGIVDPTHAQNVVSLDFRKIVLFTTAQGSTLTFAPSNTSIDEIKSEFAKLDFNFPKGRHVEYIMKEAA